MIFSSREHAGRLLAKELSKYKGKDVVVFCFTQWWCTGRYGDRGSAACTTGGFGGT